MRWGCPSRAPGPEQHHDAEVGAHRAGHPGPRTLPGYLLCRADVVTTASALLRHWDRAHGGALDGLTLGGRRGGLQPGGPISDVAESEGRQQGGRERCLTGTTAAPLLRPTVSRFPWSGAVLTVLGRMFLAGAPRSAGLTRPVAFTRRPHACPRCEPSRDPLCWQTVPSL
jgi:hypothetical protein